MDHTDDLIRLHEDSIIRNRNDIEKLSLKINGSIEKVECKIDNLRKSIEKIPWILLFGIINFALNIALVFFVKHIK